MNQNNHWDSTVPFHEQKRTTCTQCLVILSAESCTLQQNAKAPVSPRTPQMQELPQELRKRRFC